MKTDFSNNKVKRLVQRTLFTGCSAKSFIGLAGPSYQDYLDLVLTTINPRYPYLVDFKGDNKKVIKGSLISVFDYLFYDHVKRFPVDFVDADYCGSYVNCGSDIVFMYNKLKLSGKPATLAFTLSVRPGLEKTISWLNEKLFGGFLTLGTRKSLAPYAFFEKRQFAYDLDADSPQPVKLIFYRDSGDVMLSGIIKINY